MRHLSVPALTVPKEGVVDVEKSWLLLNVSFVRCIIQYGDICREAVGKKGKTKEEKERRK